VLLSFFQTIIFVLYGKPVQLLVLAGAFNGLILPIALAVILLAATKSSVMRDYKHSLVLQALGWLVVIAMSWMGFITLQQYIGNCFNKKKDYPHA